MLIPLNKRNKKFRKMINLNKSEESIFTLFGSLTHLGYANSSFDLLFSIAETV